MGVARIKERRQTERKEKFHRRSVEGGQCRLLSSKDFELRSLWCNGDRRDNDNDNS